MTFFRNILGGAILWFGQKMLFPVGALGYRVFSKVRRLFVWFLAQFHIQTSRLFSTKSIMHVVVVAIVFFVTTSNIYASTASTTQGQSVLASLLPSFEEELLIEETDSYDPSQFTESVTYLEGEAVSAPSVITYNEENIPITSTALGDGVRTDSSIITTPTEAVTVPTLAKREITQYVVADGDTIAGIASRFSVSVTTVLSANGLNARSVIRPGQKLTILPTDGVLYVVKSGDTVLSIAKKFQSNAQEIVDANGLTSSSAIKIGQRLVLPGGKLPVSAPITSTARIGSNISSVVSKPAPSAEAGTSTTKLLWPTAVRRITQYFKRTHNGVDIAGPTGTAIYASETGTIIFSGWNSGGYGNMVIIDHGQGLFTRYAHASKLLVKVGESVKRGDTIALMGSTGRSTGPHLHFEVLTGNTSNRVNPFDYTK